MKHLLTIVIGLISLHVFAQTNCNIINEYGNIFSIKKMKHGEKEFLVKSINTLQNTDCFAELINSKSSYVRYLLTNFSDQSNYSELAAIKDSTELQNTFITSLQKDSLFNLEMNTLANIYYDRKNFVPDTISMDGLLNIAVKYFSIIRLNGDGHYVGKVCTGINGLKQTEKERKPQLEAFCFTTIFNNYNGEKYNMYNEFVSGIKELYKLNLGIEEDDKLLRAQGAMYMFMRNNQALNELLLFEYENQKEHLPFVLVTK